MTKKSDAANPKRWQNRVQAEGDKRALIDFGKMHREFTRIGFLLFLGGAAVAQNSILQTLDPLSANTNGVHLYGVSLSTGYFSGNYVGSLGVPYLSSGGSNQNLTGMASASFGWSATGAKSSFSVVYSPGYVRGFYFNEFHSLSHSFALNASRTLRRKWRLGASVSAIVSDFNQLLFAPTLYGNITSTSATFDQFAGAILGGTTTNGALSTLVSSAQTVSAPNNAYLYGAREFSAAGRLSLSYLQSERSNFNFGIGANWAQALAQSGASGNGGISIPHTVSGGVSAGWSYSLTPRTHIGASISLGRTFSKYADMYSTESSASIGRTMSQRWFVQGSAGAGFVRSVHSTLEAPAHNVEYLFNGGIGFKTFTQTFLGSYARNIADSYGLGANATEGSSASWSWSRPGTSLSFYATFGYMRLIGPAFPNSGSWTEGAGTSHSLGAHFAISASYTHVSLPVGLALASVQASQSGVMLALSWSPMGRRTQ